MLKLLGTSTNHILWRIIGAKNCDLIRRSCLNEVAKYLEICIKMKKNQKELQAGRLPPLIQNWINNSATQHTIWHTYDFIQRMPSPLHIDSIHNSRFRNSSLVT